jgi:LysR family hydrogen peroxide-inducible transcriptional activator
MGMGSAFLPALYVKSEIRNEEEVRIATVSGVDVMRNHALAWRLSSPSRPFYRNLAQEIRDIITRSLAETVIPIKGR